MKNAPEHISYLKMLLEMKSPPARIWRDATEKQRIAILTCSGLPLYWRWLDWDDEKLQQWHGVIIDEIKAMAAWSTKLAAVV